MYLGDKVPVVTVITQKKRHVIVDIEIFSSTIKAESHFLMLCVENEIPFDTEKAKYIENTGEWYAHKNGKTIVLEWKTVQ